MKKVFQWLLFGLLVFLTIAQLPTGIGWNCLFLAVFCAPFLVFQKGIDKLLSGCSVRMVLVALNVVCILLQPIEEFEKAGSQMGRFLYGIFEVLNLR